MCLQIKSIYIHVLLGTFAPTKSQKVGVILEVPKELLPEGFVGNKKKQ